MSGQRIGYIRASKMVRLASQLNFITGYTRLCPLVQHLIFTNMFNRYSEKFKASEQVLRNILINAKKYVRSEGVLDINKLK